MDIISSLKFSTVFTLILAAALTLGSVDEIKAQTSAIEPTVTQVSGEIRIGQTIAIEVQNLGYWSSNHDPWKLVPYLEGRPLDGIYPEVVDSSRNQLQFHLSLTESSKDVWLGLFRHPTMTRPVAISVGLENQTPFKTTFDYDNQLPLVIVSRPIGLLALGLVLGVVSIAIFLMGRTNLIRQPGPKPSEGKSPYDLGRFLTAFWAFLISTSYFSIWLITGSTDLPASALALTGFSSIVALVSHFINTPPDTITGNDPAAMSDTSDVGANFFADVLSDSNGYSIYRFQLLFWNILFGFIFVFLVFETLALPHLRGSIIALVGISTLVYLPFELFGHLQAFAEVERARL